MYRYQSNWREGTDILIMTKKGKTESELPIGVIIPMHQGDASKYVEETDHNVYIAKHCQRLCEVTHIVPYGIVNVFGWFVTKENMPDDGWSIDIGQGWFTRKTVTDISEIERYL